MTVGMGTVTETQPHPHCRGTRRGEKPTEPPKTEGSTPQETHKARRRRHGEEKEGKHLDIQGQKCNFADTTPRQATMHHTPRPHAQPANQEATACHPPPINKDDMKAINLNNISPDDKYVT